MNKSAIILFTLFSSLVFGRADLTINQKIVGHERPHRITTWLHDDKMRTELRDDAYSVIIDLKTWDSITLMTGQKKFAKHTGAEIRQQNEFLKNAAGPLDKDMNNTPARPMATGKTEKVDGYETEIYTWSGARGLIQTLWVAKEYPNYTAIKAELAKIDRYNIAGPHKNSQPELSLLPGMVIKTENNLNGQKGTIMLVSANVEPVDASVFEVPAGYSAWQSPMGNKQLK